MDEITVWSWWTAEYSVLAHDKNTSERDGKKLIVLVKTGNASGVCKQ